jgi:hypothetical protein
MDAPNAPQAAGMMLVFPANLSRYINTLARANFLVESFTGAMMRGIEAAVSERD